MLIIDIILKICNVMSVSLYFSGGSTGSVPGKVALVEESSDESTTISSQTSTLTRNQGKSAIPEVTLDWSYTIKG